MTTGPDYTQLPPTIGLDSTVTSAEAAPLPDPEDVRSVEQFLGLTDH